MNKLSRIYVTGHNGLVGSSLLKTLKSKGYINLIFADRKNLDLTKQNEVDEFFQSSKPEYVFNCAAKVGGINANNIYPAEFIYNNLQIQNNIIESCRKHKVDKLVFLGSVCIFPKFAEVPVKEESLLTGPLEPTNQWYAIAKIAGIKMCQAYNKQYGCNFISVMPTNQYGIGDNFHLENSHVIPALIRKFVEAKEKNDPEVICWGTGNVRREFMYVDDLTDALEYLMLNYSNPEIINVGCNVDYTIKETAGMIQEIVGYKGKIIWDTSKPDGTPKRMMDSTKLFNLGWRPKITLKEGLTKTIRWYTLGNKYDS